MSSVRTRDTVGVFDVLEAVRPEEAELVAQRLAAMLRQRPDAMPAHVYVSVDGTAVVSCGQWTPPSAPAPPATDRPSAALVRALAAEPGVRSVRSLAGTLSYHIDGGAPAATPGVGVLAIRHLGGPEAAEQLGHLLLRSGEWKRHVAGFVGASAYVSADGRLFLNYARWVDQAAYEAYMADPRIAGGQGDIARLETARPEIIRCRSVAALGL
jgi:quinol monooxygenase YgiN